MITQSQQSATYTALVQAEEQLKIGQTSEESAHALIDASKDVLALALDKQVATPSVFSCNQNTYPCNYSLAVQ